VVYKVDPDYSEEALAARVSGDALLSVVVGENGQARDMKVINGLGFGLDEKAIEAVQKWRFRPGLKDGKPVAVRAQIEINFRLR
jgi:TonB family protein